MDSQILIARNLGYLDDDRAILLMGRIHEVGRILNGLLTSLEEPRDFTNH